MRDRFAGARFVTKDKPKVGVKGAVQMKGVSTGGMGPIKKMSAEAKAKMMRTRMSNIANKTLFSTRSK